VVIYKSATSAGRKSIIEIINGVHGESVGYLTGLNGQLVPIYGNSKADWLDALIRAVGPIPQPPDFGLGGQLIPVTNDKGFLTGYTYDPSGDELNTAKASAYASVVAAWSKRAELILGAAK
jgi:hypothetical protein